MMSSVTGLNLLEAAPTGTTPGGRSRQPHMGSSTLPLTTTDGDVHHHHDDALIIIFIIIDGFSCHRKFQILLPSVLRSSTQPSSSAPATVFIVFAGSGCADEDYESRERSTSHAASDDQNSNSDKSWTIQTATQHIFQK